MKRVQKQLTESSACNVRLGTEMPMDIERDDHDK